MNIAELLIPPTTVNDINKTNHSSKKHPCLWPGCGKTFSRSADVNRHFRIHTGDRRFMCEICGKRFIQRSALTVHSRTHTGEKPFLCEYPNCEKQFSDSSALARHRRIHPGNQAPHQCQLCHQSYGKKNQLLKHLEQHDSPSSFNNNSNNNNNNNNNNKKKNGHLFSTPFVLPHPSSTSSSSSVYTSNYSLSSFTI